MTNVIKPTEGSPPGNLHISKNIPFQQNANKEYNVERCQDTIVIGFLKIVNPSALYFTLNEEPLIPTKTVLDLFRATVR